MPSECAKSPWSHAARQRRTNPPICVWASANPAAPGPPCAGAPLLPRTGPASCRPGAWTARHLQCGPWYPMPGFPRSPAGPRENEARFHGDWLVPYSDLPGNSPCNRWWATPPETKRYRPPKPAVNRLGFHPCGSKVPPPSYPARRRSSWHATT